MQNSEFRTSPSGSVSLEARGLLRFAEPLAEEIFAFQREAYPARRPDWIEPRWRWMFQQSAARLGVEPMVWLYRGSSGVQAHQGAIAVRLHTSAGECVTGWFVETMVLEKVRGKAVGPMLVAKAKQDLPFNLSLGQTSQMRELQFRLGWEQVAPLETLVFVLNGRAVLASKLPAIASAPAGIALTMRQRVQHWKGRRQPGSYAVREVSRFGAAHDGLWARAKADYAVAVVRDASYLNWKYVDQPGQNFLRLEVVRGGDVAAVAVIAFQEPAGPYTYRRARLTEVVVPASDEDLVWTLFEAVRHACRERGADLIVFDVINDSLVRQAIRFGFARRSSTRVLLVSIGEQPTEAALLTRQAANWLITRGDSDIDRPW
jgi:hypothetical protein